MWFRKRPKNRAFERRHVLDVKVARREVRRMRVRVATLAAGLSLGTIFVVYMAFRCGDWALNHFVYQNKSFAIQKIMLSTDGVIALEEIRRWAAVKKNDNLFALDLNRVKRHLELVPAIQSAAVERVLPNTLRIDVVEREPVARIQNFLVDSSGFVMLPLNPQQRAVAVSQESYPIITGVSQTEIPIGREIEQGSVRSALQFLSAFDHSAMASVLDIARVDVSQPQVLRVYTAQQNEVTFGMADYEKNLNRWWLIYQEGIKAGRQIATLDLSVSDNVPLRWYETPALPPSPPKKKKASPYRKKHV